MSSTIASSILRKFSTCRSSLLENGIALIFVLKRTLYGQGVEQARTTDAARIVAVASLAVWIAAIATGRYMAYV